MGVKARVLRASTLILVEAAWLLIDTKAQTPATPASPATPVLASASLKDRSDAELLQIVTASKAVVEPKQQVYDDDRVTHSPLDRLWEMPPRDAAIAFATDHVGKEVTGAALKIADQNAQPPKSGEIGLRWKSGNKYAPRAEGVAILKYDGYRSELLLSEVEIAGQASKAQIEAAVMKTDTHPLRRAVAQQTFEILWWLRHVRFEEEPTATSSATYTSADDIGRFWMNPGGPAFEKAIIGEPCGHCIARDGIESYESFAATLLRRLQERSGIKRRSPVPKIGRHIDPDPDARFLHTPPLAAKCDHVPAEIPKRWFRNGKGIEPVAEFAVERLLR
jgi:hypothetical protein